MGKHSVKIGGREFPLAFTLQTFVRLQEDRPTLGFDEINMMFSTIGGIIYLLYQTAVSGAALEEKTLDVTQDWMAERMPASQRQILLIKESVVETITDGMEMETAEAENDGKEVDVVLNDIKKKDGKTDSPGGGSSDTD